jgi:hypothetical protein
MKTGWMAFELPGYRPHPDPTTYSLFSYEDLPPIPEDISDDFSWLRLEPVQSPSIAESGYPNGSQPYLGKLTSILAPSSISPPHNFENFINDVSLHTRIRSCTDCYLDLGDYAVRTIGENTGHLIHFLSDSQWCGHWYIFIAISGAHFVVTSENAYGFRFLDSDSESIYPKENIDLESEEIYFCAPSFPAFIYRFWLENEIWFKLVWEKEPLTAIQQAYVNSYLSFKS